MSNPPPFFEPAPGTPLDTLSAHVEPLRAERCSGDDQAADAAPVHGRARLTDLNQHLHCSLLGTYLSTAELRKQMARFIDVHGASDLDVHHEAVRLTGEDARIAKAAAAPRGHPDPEPQPRRHRRLRARAAVADGRRRPHPRPVHG